MPYSSESKIRLVQEGDRLGNKSDEQRRSDRTVAKIKEMLHRLTVVRTDRAIMDGADVVVATYEAGGLSVYVVTPCDWYQEGTMEAFVEKGTRGDSLVLYLAEETGEPVQTVKVQNRGGYMVSFQDRKVLPEDTDQPWMVYGLAADNSPHMAIESAVVFVGFTAYGESGLGYFGTEHGFLIPQASSLPNQ